MKNFLRGGKGLAVGQGDKVTKLQSDKDLSSRSKDINDRLLHFVRSDGGEMERNDERECSDKGGESLCTTFGLASPLLRPYITDLPRIHHRFTTFASGILDENVMKRCSKGDETPKLVRSRYGSDQETADLAPTVYQLSSAQDLPLFCFCSTSLRSVYDSAVTRLRSFIGASSQIHHSTIEEPSEQGGTWLGLGRYQAGSFSAYSWPIGCFSFGLQPRNKQRTTEEQANKEQGKTKQSPKNKQGINKANVSSSNTLLIHCCYFEHTWVILRQYTKSASAKLAEVIGNASGQRRTCLQACSTAIRQLFGSCSAVCRSAVEAESNTTRRSLEAVPNQSRSGAEGKSKSSRRIVEAESKTARTQCENTTFQKGIQTKVELALTQSKTKVELGMNYQTTKDELRISLERTNVELATTQERTKDKTRTRQETPKRETRIRQESRNSTSKNIPERYCKGTGKVLNSGGKGTGEVLESYQRGTKEVLTGSRSVVGYDRDGDCFGVVPTSRNGEAVVNDLRMNRLILRSFRALCEEFRTKVESMVVKENRSRQIALKELIDSKVKSKPFAYRLQLIAFMIFCVFSSVFAQSPTQVGAAAKAKQQQQEFVRDIRGTVIDAVTKKPLDGAYMYIYLDTTQSSYAARRSSNGGNFNFKGAHLQKGFIRVIHKGYVTRNIEISTSKNGPYRVEMQPESVTIEEVEVVSTGYFSVPKERATGSFTHINNELLSRSVGSNVIDRLKDVVPGLTFNQQQVGKSRIVNEPAISIRGRSTINGNASPLIVLDNFPYEGDINDINPEDIESVTVLQDAAAASIWGARAGNGVIVLNSKKGTLERPLRTSVRADYSVSAKPDLYYTPTMSMSDFVEVERFLFHKNAWNAYINQGYSYITPTVELLKQHRDKKLSDAELEVGLDVLKGQDVRHDLDRYFYRPSSLRKVSASFDGGGKANTYYFSVGYDQNLGTQHGADSKRLNLNARNSYQLWDNKLRFDMGLLFSKSQQSYTLMSGNQYNVLYDRWVDADGNALSIGGGNTFRQSYIDTAGNGLLRDWNYRPLEDLGMNNNRVDDLNYQLNAGITVKPLPWLSASIQYRYNSGNSRSHTERDAESFYIRNLYNKFAQIDYTNNIVKSAIPNGGQLNGTKSYSDQHNGRFQLDVSQSWGIHQLALLGGTEINHYGTRGQVDAALLGYKPSTEVYTPIDLSMNYRQYATRTSGALLVQPIHPSRESTVNRNILVFANGSYTYDRRYTGTFSVRKDQANIFGVEASERGKPFWSAGMLWHLHEEEFMTLPWVQRLSLRVTHGAMGNVSTASALLTSAVSSTVDYDSKRVFQRIVNPPNPMLSWEKVRMTNLAMDFAILNRKLEGSVERYFRRSTDLLSYNPMAPTSGVSRLYGNWSSMKSSGWDVTLTSRQIQGDFNWSSNLIFSHIKEMVTSYKEKPSSDRLYLTANIGSYPIEGKPLNTVYSLRYAGLDNSGNPIGYLDGEQSTDYTKIYNNTALSDYIYHGRATPNTFGSFRNNLGYKGIDLSFTLSYHLGYYFRQQAFSSSTLYNVLGYGETPFQYQYAGRWQQAGDESKTRIPAALYPINGNRDAFYGLAEDHVQKGDHIRFRDIRLSYSFPELKNKAIKGMQLYVYVDNVGVLWSANDSGYDPQAVPNIGLLFPAPRTFSFGINFNL